MIFKSFYIIFYIISVPVVSNIRDSFPTLLFFLFLNVPVRYGFVYGIRVQFGFRRNKTKSLQKMKKINIYGRQQLPVPVSYVKFQRYWQDNYSIKRTGCGPAAPTWNKCVRSVFDGIQNPHPGSLKKSAKCLRLECISCKSALAKYGKTKRPEFAKLPYCRSGLRKKKSNQDLD